MLKEADVLIENLKAGTLEKWGLGYDDVLKERFPQFIYCRLTGFGVGAESFFADLTDDVIFKPYMIVLKDMVIPNAPLFASLVKYGEIALGVVFFLGWPLRTAAIAATFLHLNYLAIASFPTFIYLNVLMIACEWAIVNSFEKNA